MLFFTFLLAGVFHDVRVFRQHEEQVPLRHGLRPLLPEVQTAGCNAGVGQIKNAIEGRPPGKKTKISGFV
jgi:hypothetical protein